MIDSLVTWLEQNLGVGEETQYKLVATLAVLLVFWVVNFVVRRLLVARIDDLRLRYFWQKTLGYILFLTGFLVVGRIWFVGFQSLATFLGLLSAGLAIALKDPITNFFGWIFIVWRRPFEIGDRIEVGGQAGDVIDLRVFQFTLMEIGNWVYADQSTGRILHIPNGLVFTQTIANFTKGSHFIWNEIPVLITFESNWEKGKNLLQEIVESQVKAEGHDFETSFRDATRRFLIQYNKLTPIVYTSVEESGVLLTIRYLCDPRQRRGSTQAIWEGILRAFSRHPDLDFAYPTQRFYSMPGERNQPLGSS
ncbi:MAG: mechanosensitive ion channel family protein [Anaerolineales bacterium]